MIKMPELVAAAALIALASLAVSSVTTGAATYDSEAAGWSQAAPIAPQQASSLPRVDPRLYEAVWRGELDQVQELIAAGVEVNAVDADDNPVLREAIWRKHTEIVRALIDAGADVDARDADGHPVLREAIWREHTEIVEVIVHVGANLDARDSDDDPLLHEAIWRGYTEIVRILVDAGADVNVVDADGDSMLHEARWRGYSEIVQILVAAGATDPIKPTTDTPSQPPARGTEPQEDACQPGMTLSEGDACTVAGADVVFGTDVFTIHNGLGCFADVCISGSVRFNEFAATQSGSSWTVVSAPGAEPPGNGPSGTAGAEPQESQAVVDGEAMTAGAVQGRIVARLLADGRIEFGFQPDGSARILPRPRFFPVSSVGRWLFSGAVVHGAETLGRITARRLDDGRVEFGFMPAGGERLLPRLRLFPVDATVGRWLRSSLIEFTLE
ncbi:MAG: ankyrin repeat domain-containing protein [Chloroflexi bacterium]|nr:ankyrin repeat domain-containing protein [Chloroflexota bacterium]MYC00492.1 ankyrin repeat domain-containing protein [Chloroflexota bacterium]